MAKTLANSTSSIADIPKLKILTSQGIIEAEFCPDPYEEAANNPAADTLNHVLQSVAAQIDVSCAQNPSEDKKPLLPFEDSTPLLLRNVTINQTIKLPYMLIFPCDIIGISL